MKTGVSVILLITILFFLSCSDCQEEVNSQRDLLINAVVDSIYESKQNRYTPTVRIYDSSSNKYFELDGYSFPILLDQAVEGGKITKNRNSLLYRLIKLDGTVITFNPVCNGEKIE